jgi:hypothetical protein
MDIGMAAKPQFDEAIDEANAWMDERAEDHQFSAVALVLIQNIQKLEEEQMVHYAIAHPELAEAMAKQGNNLSYHLAFLAGYYYGKQGGELVAHSCDSIPSRGFENAGPLSDPHDVVGAIIEMHDWQDKSGQN